MSTNSESNTPGAHGEQERQKRFAAAVNRHGYAFQNAILKRCHELFDAGRTRWVFEVAEFPAEVNGNGTRIDFVLWTHQTDVWLLCECKRVNPALADWFFARTSYVRRGGQHERLVAELSQETPNGTFLSEGVYLDCPPSKLVAHRGFEVKTDQHGEWGSSREPIEDAASQVSKGLNGMVSYLSDNRTALGKSKRRILVPVIFTTANLWVSDSDLADADLLTGKIDPGALKLEQVPYLFYQYHLSPGIKHSFAPVPNPQASLFVSELSYNLATEFIRTILVVSASGVERFMAEMNTERFSLDPIAR